MSGLTKEQFEKLMKDIFSGNNDRLRKRQMICAPVFIQCVYDEFGKQGLIDLANQCELTAGESGVGLFRKLTI